MVKIFQTHVQRHTTHFDRMHCMMAVIFDDWVQEMLIWHFRQKKQACKKWVSEEWNGTARNENASQNKRSNDNAFSHSDLQLRGMNYTWTDRKSYILI